MPSLDDNGQSLADVLNARKINNVVTCPNPAWCAEAIVLHVGPASAAHDNVPLQAHVDESVKEALSGGLIVVFAQEGCGLHM